MSLVISRCKEKRNGTREDRIASSKVFTLRYRISFEDVLTYRNLFLQGKRFSPTQALGVIFCITRTTAPQNFHDYRTILLEVGYKIYAPLLANSVSPVAHDLTTAVPTPITSQI